MQFRGNLGADPVAGQTRNGKPFVRFPVAEKTGSGEFETVTWYRVKLYGDPNKAAQLAKGMYVEIVGTLTPRIYERDGKAEVSLDVSSGLFKIIGNDDKKGGNAGKRPQVRSTEKAASEARHSAVVDDADDDEYDDDIPF